MGTGSRRRGEERTSDRRRSEASHLPSFSPKPFSCELVASGPGAVRVVAAGELDMATVPVMEARLNEARSAGFRRLEIDLRGLAFIDSTGLTLLVRWSLGAEHDGFDLALVRGADRIQRLFSLTGMAGHFEFLDA